MPSSIPIEFASERLILLADRAIYWPEQQALILADVHLGKDASFRAAGMPVPAGNSSKDLARIEALLAQTGAKKLIILGDLVHNRASHQPELAAAFDRWRTVHHCLDVLLVRGNHDRSAGPPPENWRIDIVEQHDCSEMLSMVHHPQPSKRALICGHVHPTVSVQDFDRTFVTLPCFVVGKNQMILPAFGSFTGGFKVRQEPHNRIYAVVGKSVVALPV